MRIREEIPEIIHFAELEEFADRPVRTYSSGMALRLSFAVAVHVRPDIFLIDEVLAVGDTDFQEKCFGHFESLKRDGVTIVLVSHDLSAIERFSDRVALLEHGRITTSGEPRPIVSEYLRDMAEHSPGVRRALERVMASWQQNDRASGSITPSGAGVTRGRERQP